MQQLKEKTAKKTSIGGQALIEGVMMRGVSKTAMASRLPDGTIDVETWDTESEKSGKWFRKAPFIRGIFNLVDSLTLGYKCLMKSAEKAGFEDEEPSKFELKLKEKLGDKFMGAVTGFAGVLGVVLAIVLFMLVPTYLVKLVEYLTGGIGFWKNVLEGAVKIGIFIAYLAAISKMSEIRRVFEYHGGEHKSIFCYEKGMELTPENASSCTRFHPRCGTSFLLIVLVISILVFSLLPWGNGLLRVAYKLLLLPVVIGIAYEIIKFAGRHDNIVTRIISAPGLWLQRLTTREPDDSQLEVALAALKAVLPKEGEDDNW
ncbi:DUF1385 domain-containing protein [Acetanaerobacterium elongatum]|uniref:Uncharacterized conserved protein YqhQ n=1 Tax=Acetanaerobacterium elongatum TaxID=258515 RepID=A0A1G9V0J9_9FIRM|nr:DUF1385 domain-containing protein [Acetanaerobacterium elongatum]SDM65643.1 Uncharacterized conserved protein YqhQ [Acetanaerobacterium elongatum]